MNLNEKLSDVIMVNISILSSISFTFGFFYFRNFVNYIFNSINTNDVFIILFSILLGIYSLSNTFVKYKMSRELI